MFETVILIMVVASDVFVLIKIRAEQHYNG